MTDLGDFSPAEPASATERTRRHGVRIALVLGLAVGLPVAAVVAGIAVLVSLVGAGLPNAGKPNTAEQAAVPIMTALHQAGDRVICEDGDAGYSFDNTEPWYVAYVEVSDADAGRRALLTAAAANGLTLVPHDGSALTDPDFDAASSPVVTSDDGPPRGRLSVLASSRAPVDIDCVGGDAKWGTPEAPKAGGAIYEIMLSEPPHTP